MQSLREMFRLAVSEGSDTGMLIAADAMEESGSYDGSTLDNKMGELLRLYVNVQTYVRMSLPIPLEIAKRYEELNIAFDMPSIENHGYPCEYSKPLGYYYTNLHVRQDNLANQLDLLSIEPVRELELDDCAINDDLALILRNYRMDMMFHVTMRFYRRNIGNPLEAFRGMKASSLMTLTIYGASDRLKLLQTAFLSAPGIARGAKLQMARSRYSPPALIATKR